MPQIIVVCGNMFAGKTTYLIKAARQKQSDGLKVLVIKHAWDTRYNNSAVTINSHDGDSFPAHACNTLFSLDSRFVSQHKVIIIDEGQFFSDLLEFVEQYRRTGHQIIIGGLDYTYKKEPFGQMGELCNQADEVIHLFAKCACGQRAQWTKRVEKNIPKNLKGETIIVGGAELYQPSCDDCFNL